jgi:ferredoxin-NADP reductase
MAQAKSARVVRVATVGRLARLVELEPAEPLGFVGGQYLIVNSGVVLDGGKLAKRAYSILSPDAEQGRVQLAVRQIAAGPASSYLHAVEPGAEVGFSGPWGQYLPDDARPRPTWVVATDTGITAALGLVRGCGFLPQRPHARVLWLVSDDDFVPAAMVRELAGLPVEQVTIPPVGHPERVAAGCAALAQLSGRPESVFLSGDGALLYPLRDRLAAAGVPVENVRIESFFNNPSRKAP